jgi:hypothetical protein
VVAVEPLRDVAQWVELPSAAVLCVARYKIQLFPARRVSDAFGPWGTDSRLALVHVGP